MSVRKRRDGLLRVATAIMAAMSNPAKRAASNHTPGSNVILGSLMTTSGAAINQQNQHVLSGRVLA